MKDHLKIMSPHSTAWFLPQVTSESLPHALSEALFAFPHKVQLMNTSSAFSLGPHTGLAHCPPYSMQRAVAMHKAASLDLTGRR